MNLHSLKRLTICRNNSTAEKKGYVIRRLSAALVALMLAIGPVHLGAAGNHSGQKTVHVKEYTKKDGTTVEAHDRTPPRPKDESSSIASAPSSSSATVKRNADGKIERSEAAKQHFMNQTGYPHGRPGYVVDHIRPLACGGADDPSNMQWQTVDAAKAKDKWERAGWR